MLVPHIVLVTHYRLAQCPPVNLDTQSRLLWHMDTAFIVEFGVFLKAISLFWPPHFVEFAILHRTLDVKIRNSAFKDQIVKLTLHTKGVTHVGNLLTRGKATLQPSITAHYIHRPTSQVLRDTINNRVFRVLSSSTSCKGNRESQGSS